MTKRKDPADLKKRGRPSKYDPAFVKQAEKLCALGATDAEMADFFEVSIVTFNAWKAQHPDFLKSLKDAKGIADNRVERSLYQRAVGFAHDAVKIFMPANAAAPVYAPYREQFPPDTAAAIFWLKNRRKEQWRDKQDHELTGKDGAPLNTGPTIIFSGAPEHSSPPQAVGGASKRGD
jgi:hypothetical protein